MSMLTCHDLTVEFITRRGVVRAVNGVSFDLEPGHCLGIVGESGSGKTQTCMAIGGLLPRNARVTGSVQLGGRELLGATTTAMRAIRGKSLSYVFQDPMTALTPHLRVGRQLSDVLLAHEHCSKGAARQRALEIMERVQIPDAARRYEMYPFELSGGMRQRVMIAMALILKPQVILADEPTTALDVTVQAEILAILRAVIEHTATSVVLVTHDLGVVAGICDEVLVMYAGRVVERAPVDRLFAEPQHPYTQALLACIPRADVASGAQLETISGQPPDPQALPPGCAFEPRCPLADDGCRQTAPALRARECGRAVACHRLTSTAG